MSQLISREIHLVSRPEGIPEPANFALVEREIAPPKDGEVLIQNVFMSVDPAMRPPLTNGQTPLNEVMGGSAIGRVLESRNPAYKEGELYMNRRAFREYFVTDGGRELQRIVTEGESPTTHMHVLGGTGLTAWGGLLVIGQLKEGENLFVSAAAGAVGSVACQIGKIMNCNVAGSCGADDKVAWLKEELGVDHAFNYKTASVRKELHVAFPQGIDVYFDNVGGDQLDAAVGQMRPLGRIPISGMISGYNNRGSKSEGVTTLSNMIYNRVTMRGFVATEFVEMRPKFLADMRRWMAEGKMKYRETIFEGIEQAPHALIGLFTGANTGKMLVRLASD